MDVGRGLLTIDQGDNMGMMKAFQDMDLRVQIFFELFIELIQIDGLDGNVARLLL